MKVLPNKFWNIWRSGQFVGENRPVTRATIQKARVETHKISNSTFRSLPFDDAPHMEIRNIRSVNIDRRIGTDAGSMSMVLVNQRTIRAVRDLDLTHDEEKPWKKRGGATTGPSVRSLKDLEQPGFYSYRRGATPLSRVRWGHGYSQTWVDMLVPNRLIRTYQGYGANYDLEPHVDGNLVLTGLWLIDTVEFRADATIQIQCRDLAKLLLEQHIYPPVIPKNDYPLRIIAPHEYDTGKRRKKTISTPAEYGPNRAKHSTSAQDSSNYWWVGTNGAVRGHRPSHAFDGNKETYWMSTGVHGKRGGSNFVWIQSNTGQQPIRLVRMYLGSGGYTVYLSVRDDKKWLTRKASEGGGTIPYTSRPGYDIGGAIPYLMKRQIPMPSPGHLTWRFMDLEEVFKAEGFRLTFTNLIEQHDMFRANVRTIQAMRYKPATSKTKEVPIMRRKKGNIRDYTAIVKLLCAWGGFYWPQRRTKPKYKPDRDLKYYLQESLSDTVHVSEDDGDGNKYTEPIEDDEGLITHGKKPKGGEFGESNKHNSKKWYDGLGRVWGDFDPSGAYPVDPAELPADTWDQKTLMEGINTVKDVLGYIFFIDSTGGAVFRPPNIWRLGNYKNGNYKGGVDHVPVIDERTVLMDYGVSIDDANLRSQVIVVSKTKPSLMRAIRPGYAVGETPSFIDEHRFRDTALLGGQERVMVVGNFPLQSQREVDMYAYLSSLWMHWSYRKGRVRIPGIPAFEPDDQVRIVERVTSESYFHYILSVSSNMDMDAGTWHMELDTHWLGSGPGKRWVVDSYKNMPPALFEFLVKIGQINADGTNKSELPPGWDPQYHQTPEGGLERDIHNEKDIDDILPNLPDVSYVPPKMSDRESNGPDGGSDAPGGTPAPDPPAGAVNHRSEAWRYAYWGNHGPSDVDRFTFMEAYPSGVSYPVDIPQNSHPLQSYSVPVVVDRYAWNAFRFLAYVLADYTYEVYPSETGGYKLSWIKGTTIWSAHAWGLAIDINWDKNALGKRSGDINQNFRHAAAQAVYRIRLAQDTDTRVFGWGGYWETKREWAHFEIIVTKQQLEQGVILIDEYGDPNPPPGVPGSGWYSPLPGQHFSDTFGAPRSGGRTHAGTDHPRSLQHPDPLDLGGFGGVDQLRVPWWELGLYQRCQQLDALLRPPG